MDTSGERIDPTGHVQTQEGATSSSASAGETPSRARFDEAYLSHTAPWVIGEPQPAIVALERSGWIRGRVLDVGCGTGEHSIHLARLGYDMLGIDVSERAVEQARANADRRGVTARIEVADALHLELGEAYDTIIDSALFHIFAAADRARYVHGLHRACRPDGRVHVLALSDVGPGFGPQVSDAVIREAFGDGWDLEDLQPTTYRGVILHDTHATALDRHIGDVVDVPAWLARARRI